MFETMYEDNGIGLAAIQVGIDKQIFVIDLSETRNQPMVFINPVIVEKTGTQKCQEGCLSLPGIFAEVKRAEFVKVEALDKNGEKFTNVMGCWFKIPSKVKIGDTVIISDTLGDVVSVLPG